jgi:hypothetical protein
MLPPLPGWRVAGATPSAAATFLPSWSSSVLACGISPPLTAIDLATFECADAIDMALRTRAATLEGMYQALRLTPNRIGNQQRLKLLIDSRNEPWSAAERLAHRILRGAGLTSWRTNFLVILEGRIYYIDIAFPHLKLAIEIDGRLHEDDEDLFESDRWRQNALVANG